eukprot:TRINITY_DN31655_c0_g1_i1.p2 TRINITY_DN31655_c0_g1~~TRINITY_DN31655_c0_g1_i1.p2  ORF type:complete len:194 (+),score=65.88 TRINITY_DN31655_c0_g1_i1:45-626(+)
MKLRELLILVGVLLIASCAGFFIGHRKTSDLQDDLRRKTLQLSDLKKTVENLSAEKGKLLEQVDGLQRESTDAALEIATCENLKKQMMDTVAKVNEDNIRLRREIEAKDKEKNDLQGQIDAEKTAASQCTAAAAEKDKAKSKMQQEIADLRQEIKGLRDAKKPAPKKSSPAPETDFAEGEESADDNDAQSDEA